VLSRKATNTNFIVFGLTRPGLEPTIYRIRGEHADHNRYCLIEVVTKTGNHIGGVVVSMLSSNAVDRGFKPRPGQTKDYKIGICCLSLANFIT
jgi:hypothetical protein